MENIEDPGLVISSKTGRTVEEQLVGIAESVNLDQETTRDELASHHIVFTPGSVRLRKKHTDPKPKSPNYEPRKAITAWSRKSRANMVARFASLDLSPMLDDPNRLAVMITLTYPGEWLSVAPSAKHAKKHLHAFRKQFERKFRRPLYAMWKTEFQRRGAVHFHIFCVAPIKIQDFRDWVATAWSDIVSHSDEAERAKHLLAGTAVDVAKGALLGEAQLVAIYFSKHSSPSLGSKEYQNIPPQEWLDAGSVGRFWGYWGLRPVEVEARLTEEEIIQVARLLRRWFRAQRFTRVVRVLRVNRQGVIRDRYVRRRATRLTHSYGFMVLGDAQTMLAEIARFILRWRDQRNAGLTGSRAVKSPAQIRLGK